MSDNRDHLRKLALQATPGPWKSDSDAVTDARECDVADCMYRRDAAFIAAFNPKKALELLDEIERLRALADVCRDLCEAKMWEDEEAEQEAGDRVAEILNQIGMSIKGVS